MITLRKASLVTSRLSRTEFSDMMPSDTKLLVQMMKHGVNTHRTVKDFILQVKNVLKGILFHLYISI